MDPQSEVFPDATVCTTRAPIYVKTEEVLKSCPESYRLQRVEVGTTVSTFDARLIINGAPMVALTTVYRVKLNLELPCYSRSDPAALPFLLRHADLEAVDLALIREGQRGYSFVLGSAA
ncbi:hypothetical protein H0H92_008349 [Tricholoma furcatifolium]|nr:hypothetical protein H0H92_008349 [Tricholoma furcatifolium]